MKRGGDETSAGIQVQARREFLRAGATLLAGLVIGFRLPPRARADGPAQDSLNTPFSPNAFVRISPDGRIAVLSKFIEMGQGAYTAVAACIAEELDADWADVSVEHSPTGPEYAHPWFGFQMTGGSSSVATSHQAMRKAGATARAMLVAAAAARWNLSADSLRTESSWVIAPDSRRARYAELCLDAATLPQPTHVRLKDPSEFRLLGRPLPRVDSLEKIRARSVFGIDVVLPGMLTGILVRPPDFGGKLKTFDATATRSLPGVRRIALAGDGVAVLATDFWSARRGAELLRVEWRPGPLAALDSTTQRDEFVACIEQPGAVAKRTGQVDEAFDTAPIQLEAEFDYPYLAHACLEPVNATAHVKPDGSVEVWAPTQMPDADRDAAARVAGVASDRVKLHVTMAGGSFGRKAGEDFVPLAVELSRLAAAPVKLVWRREDDMRGGYYRPRTLVRLRVGCDARGQPVSWESRVASPSIIKNTSFARAIFRDGIDHAQIDAFSHLPFSVEHQRHTWHMIPDGVPVLAWRDPGPIIACFAGETLLDEAATRIGQDPFDYRLRLFAEKPRTLAVLELLRERAGWGAAPSGRFQGLALKDGGSTIVGEVAEISIDDASAIRVHRVTLVVDCGFVINPDGVRAQMMSGVIFGLSAALREEITFRAGQVVQSNFHDYPVLRLPDAPPVDIHIIPSDAPPGGAGEPSTPLIAPAVANAVFRATGRRLRTLPLRLN